MNVYKHIFLFNFRNENIDSLSIRANYNFVMVENTYLKGGYRKLRINKISCVCIIFLQEYIRVYLLSKINFKNYFNNVLHSSKGKNTVTGIAVVAASPR